MNLLKPTGRHVSLSALYIFRVIGFIELVILTSFLLLPRLCSVMDGTRKYSSGFSHALSNLVRSDFWFLDGNIIIIAGQAAFKVHRGQLERHSDIFNGLFSIPQPQELDLFDGCLYVELHDSPSDVFYFLSALYDGLYVHLSPGAHYHG